MTLIVLTVLAAAWLGYFALWFRDRRASRPRHGDSFVGFTPSFDASGRRAVSIGSVGESARPRGDLLEYPRTRRQALRRRRHVATVLIALALASLAAVPVWGATALAVHVLADVGLLLFAFGSSHRQQAPSMGLAGVRVLYPDRLAQSDAMAVPLRRVVNG